MKSTTTIVILMLLIYLLSIIVAILVLCDMYLDTNIHEYILITIGILTIILVIIILEKDTKN